MCITFRKLISVDNDEVLTFRPLSGVPKASLKLMWKNNRTLTPQASIFLEKLKKEMQITQSDRDAFLIRMVKMQLLCLLFICFFKRCDKLFEKQINYRSKYLIFSPDYVERCF